MARALTHRAPEDHGTWVDEGVRVALGHCRRDRPGTLSLRNAVVTPTRGTVPGWGHRFPPQCHQRVAFPNKFAEYVNAGLITVLTQRLAEPTALSLSYGVSLVLDSPWTSLAASFWRDALLEALTRRNSSLHAFYAACHDLVRDHLMYSRNIRPLIDKI